ncbi:MAG: chemotaxis protein CheB [Sphingobacteriales bacterium]|nr:MAG: chemotaxis protein CheB [Sphingobacteriales bacterium]
MERSDNFAVVGIGASAGGLQALQTFFENIPADTNIAFVVIVHIPRQPTSNLDQILSRTCKIPVSRVDVNTRIEPGNIYVIIEGYYLLSVDGSLVLMKRDEHDKINKAVDVFFDSLAQDFQSRAAGIVLSGTGTDGVEGVKAIEARGGFVMVQQPDTARFDGMPMSIITFDHPDIIDTPENLAEFIVSYGKQVSFGGRKTG